eukprot:6187841-Pleurochrysis_carterae.AAC.1
MKMMKYFDLCAPTGEYSSQYIYLLTLLDARERVCVCERMSSTAHVHTRASGSGNPYKCGCRVRPY